MNDISYSYKISPDVDDGNQTITRTFDTQLVREILSDPKLNKRVTRDGDVMMFDPENQRELYYLLATDGDETIGFVLYHMFNSPICFQLHLNYLSKYWGSNLDKYTKKSVDWMLENTDARKLIALCPTIYPTVKAHISKSGFTEEGILKDSSIFNNKICDNAIMGLSK